MARLAPSTIPGAHFVDLAPTRRQESLTALSKLGHGAFYGELPDSKLSHQWYRYLMSLHIVSLVHKHNITAIATMGEQGYCGHSDHTGTHWAALGARELLRQNGRPVQVFALNHNHTGDINVPVIPERKLGALATHKTQMPLNNSGGLADEFWQQHPHYLPLLTAETYDIM